MLVDYFYEIEGLEMFLEKEQENYRDMCKRKAEALKVIDELETEETITEAGISGIMLVLDNLRKLQNEYLKSLPPSLPPQHQIGAQ